MSNSTENDKPRGARSSFIGVILAMGLTTLIAVVAGAGLAWYQKQGGGLIEAGSGASVSEAHYKAPTAGPYVKHLNSIVTNLARPPELRVRLEAAILFSENDIPDALVQMLAADTTALLRTLTLTQIEGSYGLNFLREDLKERLATRSEGRVSDILIQSLVVQ